MIRRAQTMSTPRKMDASLVPSLESVFFVPNNPPSSNGTPFVPPSTDSANTTISLDNEADESAEINPFSVDNQLLFQNLFLNATPFWNFDLPALQQQPFDCFGFPIVFSDLDKVATPEFDDSSDDCFDEFLVFSSPDRAQAFDMYTVNGNQTDFVNSDATPHLMSILTRTELKQRECVEINEVKDSDEEDELSCFRMMLM
ncbi:hypothetical protein BCR33DRAFT_342689 [Rhizoclosmatium globosum]|uniref:Uncharacterized protein n=1 Tax=Rhizoclosmatium globosum TaxID=329046 RepID=A0A1Y2C4I5_9FUNG|nr:hypothetical protein BCR33DRAFT_342689 [Rhizoclosmatium globosum]|eukprot:ORY41235.1 hypothetical protein BCR33DRAFT_342689 [Rhizoclosmatium globosum]